MSGLPSKMLATVLLAVVTARSAELLPWQDWIEVPIAAETRSLESLLDLDWRSSGGQEGTLSISAEPGLWGGRYFRFLVKIDHFNEGAYPKGWPAFEVQPRPPLDFSGYAALRYRVRADTKLDRPLALRFILWTDGAGRINELIPSFAPGRWVEVTHRLQQVPHLDKVERVHFFLCESDYSHGDEVEFQIGGFELCNLKREVSRLAPGAAAMGLWVGEQADSSEAVVIIDQGRTELPGLAVVETGLETRLRADDQLRVRCHEVFSEQELVRDLTLGQEVGPGQVVRLPLTLETGSLSPGYYLVVSDVRRQGESRLGGRVGATDLYVRKPDESMTQSVLSIRTGMVIWVRDLLYGDIMCRTRIALPHVYDPLAKETYAEFLRRFAVATGKHTEGNEAGLTGLALAAEAFRKTGDVERCRFTEGLMEDSCRHMLGKMQAPSGAAITWTNELADKGIGKGGPTEAFGSYDSNQIGEWMRALVYAMIYFRDIPGKDDLVQTLSRACRRAGDYLVAHATQESDGVPAVLRHLRLDEAADGTVRAAVYHQEGRQCDVYLGRALAGLSYYACASQLLGEKVPETWWPVLDNTVRWSAAKMKPNGWFDWQCEDQVEGGCHTFLGNLYIGEGLFGCYLASRLAGHGDAATAAAAATRKAYHYVTDDCWVHGRRFEYPLEFWVGPYLYWLFTEYLDAVGPDEVFTGWLSELDRRWSVERGWRDFLERAPRGGCGRTDTNGMLEVSILGYLGLKRMGEVGKPLHWRVE